jgi:hypothetical protein
MRALITSFLEFLTALFPMRFGGRYCRTRRALKSEGALLVYQFTGVVLSYLSSVFGGVKQTFQLLNMMSARIFYCIPELHFSTYLD